MTPYKKRWGDRFDARWVRELDSLHAFMPYIFPNRTDNEAFLSVSVDLTHLNGYLKMKNESNPESRYSTFQALIAALVRTMTLRPMMNRFIKGCRIYHRDKLTFAFVVKKKFADDAHEALAFIEFGEDDTIDTVHNRLMQEINECRSEKPDNSTAAMDFLTKFPRPVLRFIMFILNTLEFYGRAPYDLIKTDPNHASIFLTNLGSIGLKAGYHHLTNWGTNSVFIVLGEKTMRPHCDEAGNMTMREYMDLGITLDERIADGYYYSGTVKLLEHLLSHPELLDQRAKEPVNYE